ncbi:MAG: hypothetical protein FP816_03865 [Desulfobacteraceae bacterium]|nr:hypothetical protein [Desulfobacteraceae bacterium]MBU4055934.1 hypothetical protein [Pseudomonadota bacterium]
MQENLLKSPGTIESSPKTGPEIDYSPKTYTLLEQIVSGAKMIAVGGIIVAILWGLQKYLG